MCSAGLLLPGLEVKALEVEQASELNTRRKQNHVTVWFWSHAAGSSLRRNTNTTAPVTRLQLLFTVVIILHETNYLLCDSTIVTKVGIKSLFTT